jgi:GTP-sensing pleiotropic transcriptional regulator CodY
MKEVFPIQISPASKKVVEVFDQNQYADKSYILGDFTSTVTGLRISRDF